MSNNVEMEQKPSFTQKSVLNTAMLLALVSIITALIPSVLDLQGDTKTGVFITLVSYLITIFILVNALKKYRNEESGGYMSFSNGFLFVLYTSIIVGIIMAIFTFIQLTFIDADMLDEAFNKQMAEMEKNGMSEEQIEMANSITAVFRSPAVLSTAAFLGQLVFGAIIGAILGAIFQKNRPVY
ncbi:MAG TPA: DUF4199 domain-containing protein [Saprospiraceae bacterium]|jgi:hypothetical protein|nr:DUF4199 domain-containing protein [Saprospiraceae bacterium]